jgi:DNA end-binding protein Ku
MPARSTWKGFLKVSLVSIPIKVYPAAESGATLSFNQLHAECQSRIQQKRWCPNCHREVANTEIVKGYEFEKGHYVVLADEDFAKVTTESTRVINLVQFSADEELDPIYLDRAYYLAPDGPMASAAYAVMREGMRGKVGIGKVALYGREYLVAVRPRDTGLVMFTLHQASEMRTADAIDELRAVPAELRPDEVALAKQVVSTFDGKLDLSNFHDEYRDGLRAIIDAKIAGQEVVATSAPMAEPRVVDLMEALRRSLDTVGAGKKKTVKAELPTPAVAPKAAKPAGPRPVAAKTRTASGPRAVAAERTKRKAG